MMDSATTGILHRDLTNRLKTTGLEFVTIHSDLVSHTDLVTTTVSIFEEFLVDMCKQLCNVELEINHIYSPGDSMITRKYHDYDN